MSIFVHSQHKYNMREDTWIIELLNDNFLHMNNFKSIPLQPSDIVLIGLLSWFSKWDSIVWETKFSSIPQ